MDRAEMERWRQRFSEKLGEGTPVAAAIEAEQWELAALHTLIGALELIHELGPSAFEALLDELVPDPAPHRGSRARKRSPGRGRRA